MFVSKEWPGSIQWPCTNLNFQHSLVGSTQKGRTRALITIFPIFPADKFKGPPGLKIAFHAPGLRIDPDYKEPTPNSNDIELLMRFASNHRPDAGELADGQTCLYTYSEDAHFYINYLPEYESEIAIACGFSGQGFKFAPVVGEILADLVTKGGSDLTIEFLQLSRTPN